MTGPEAAAQTAVPPVVSHRVEHVDTDASGVVHFSRYASLLETAALDLLDRRGAGLEALQAAGVDLRVRELHITYRAAARFRDRLLLSPRVEHVGAASLRLEVKIHREDAGSEPALLASGRLNLAVVDLASGVPACLPETLKNLLTPEP